MRKIYSIAFIMVVLIFTSTNVDAQIKPEVSKASYFDISKPLTEMMPMDNTLVRKWKNGIVKNRFRNKNTDLVDNKFITPNIQRLNGQVNSKAPTVNIEGCNNGDNSSGVAPPDTQGDVGPNHYMQAVNNVTEIFDKSGNSLWGPQNTSVFWDGFNGSWTGTNDGDPIILYDEVADRWLVSQFAVNTGDGTQWELIAISTSPDPTGTYYRYAFEFTDMPDYPKFGIWHDGYYMAANRFTTSGGNFNGTYACAFDRDAMLTGDAGAQMIKFDNNSSSDPYSMLPSDCDGSFPSVSTPNYFCYDTDDDTYWSSDRVKVWAFSADWVTPGNSSFTEVASLTPGSFNSSFSGTEAIDQPGSQDLHTLADRLMFRAQYRDFGTHESIVLSRTVNLGSDHAGVRWYELRKTTGNWSIYQEGTYAPDTDSRWMSSIAMNGNGDIALGYSVSGASTYPSIRYAGRYDGDALGSLTIAEESIFEGTASQSGVSRWGDYSMMSVDPSDDNSFWYTQEYSDGGWDWRTRIAKFNFPYLEDPSLTASGVSTTQIDLSWNKNGDGDDVLLAWSTDGNFGTPVDGTSYSAGNSISGGGTVLYVGSGTSYNHTSLNPGTTYYYKAWSLINGNPDYSPGIATSATTLKDAIFYDGFETDEGWTFVGEWERNAPQGLQGDSYGSPDPTTAFNGSNVLGVDLTGNGDYLGGLGDHAEYSISPVINCSAYTDVEIEFQRWLGIEQPSYDHAYIDISNDGGSTWTELWTNSETIDDGAWNKVTIDVSTYADGQATVQFRFSIGVTDGSWNYCGWNLDDFYVFGTAVITTPTATVSSTPGCGTGSVTVSSNMSGTQTFYLRDNGGGAISDWTGDATSHEFTGLANGTYKGQVDNGGNMSALSSATTLTNLLNPVAPTSVDAALTTSCAGVPNQLTYTGGSGDTFEWYSASCGGTHVGTDPLSGFVSPSETTTYYGRWENTCGVSVCESVTITITPDPVAPTSVSATATEICIGDNTTLSYSGGSGDAFEWYTSSCGGTSAGTGNNLSVSPTTTTTYYGRWENSCSNSTCESVTVTVGDNTVISNQPVSVNASEGDNVNFSVVATGDNLTYQWRFNNTDISGAESDTYSITNVQVSDAGNYDVVVSGDCGNETSDVAVLTVSSSVENLAKHGISIYPNPSNGKFNIELSKSVNEANILISDITGKIIFEKNINSSLNEIDLNSNSKGVYFIKINIKGNTIVSKLIIE